MNNVTNTSNAADTLGKGENISQAVVQAVADAEGVSTTDLRPPLYAVVDPDALDELVISMARWSDGSAGRVTFSYCGYEVSVSVDGEVSLAEEQEPGDPENLGNSNKLGNA